MSIYPCTPTSFRSRVSRTEFDASANTIEFLAKSSETFPLVVRQLRVPLRLNLTTVVEDKYSVLQYGMPVAASPHITTPIETCLFYVLRDQVPVVIRMIFVSVILLPIVGLELNIQLYSPIYTPDFV
jgi:hypothetical protein